MSRLTVKKAVIPAAGLGTRFLPVTKAMPKEMLPIVDVPTIQLVIDEALMAGIEQIVLVTGRGKGAVEDYFDIAYELEDTLARRGKTEMHREIAAISRRVNLISVRQKEPLGLGHAVLAARDVVGDEPVCVLLPDDLIDTDDVAGQRPGVGQLLDQFESLGGQSGVIALVEVPEGQEHLYGIVAGHPVAGRSDRLLKLTDLVEKPPRGSAPSRLAIIGRYILPHTIWSLLEQTKPGKNGEIQLTDALKALAERDGGGCYGYRFEGERHDAGDRIGYLRATLSYALKRPALRSELIATMHELLARYGA